MKKLIIFNWKMNPSSYREAERIIRDVLDMVKKSKRAEVVVCPPFVWLLCLSKRYGKSAKFCAQDVFWEEKGAYTGEISASMLKNSKVEYVIAGHSERRKYLGETDEMINRKVLSALQVGLRVVLCVGEDLKIRRRGKKAVMAFVKKQLEKDLTGTKNLKLKTKNLIVAYEPIWAISTSRNSRVCKPEDALEMIKFIKNFLKTKNYKLKTVKVLYGGSVTGKNIQDFIKYKEIDGALVGGASLKSAEVKNIIKIASEHSA